MLAPNTRHARKLLAWTRTILLGEDEDVLRKIAKLALPTHGYTVIDASGVGQERLRVSWEMALPIIHATTILAVRRDGKLAVGGDGQVSVGDTVMKAQAVKVRALKGGKVLAGFAGSAADALTLFEKFEEKLERFPGNLPRAAVELAKDWRSDRVLRRLEALLVVADVQHGYMISGNGEIIEPDDGVLAIGSGGAYAQAAARALMRETTLGPRDIVQKAMQIAGEICIYTNTNITVLEPEGQ